MCGIAGLAQPGGPLNGAARIHSMLEVLDHRGPDGQGHWQGERAVLGATRLAIVDPENGAQPMKMGPIVGVMNGQLYNHIPLRKELDARGQTHKTLCDTEVMVGLAAEVGMPKALERMDGMFALAIWDERDQSLHLARDRVGQKPLYWTQLQDGTVAFASELKGLLVLPGVARELDPVALQQLLLFEFVPAPRSIYKGIHKLEAGTWLRADADGVRVQRWWEPPLPGERRSQFGSSREKCLNALHTAVNQAVGRRLPDGPLALLLSGGVDSSIVAHCATQRRQGLHSSLWAFEKRASMNPAQRAPLPSTLDWNTTPFSLGSRTLSPPSPSWPRASVSHWPMAACPALCAWPKPSQHRATRSRWEGTAPTLSLIHI